MPGAFASLPAHEKQAFFSLLDEYFESRPHLLPGGRSTAAHDDGAYHDNQIETPSPSRSQPPPPAARRAPPAGSSSSASIASRMPSGLTTGKALGRMNTSSKGAAFGSLIMGGPKPEEPKTAGDAIKGALPPAHRATSQTNPPPAPAPRSTPAPPARAAAPDLGQAEVLYDYQGGEAEDLVVKRFEVIDLTERVSDDWWKARARDGSGRTGIVPSSYVKQL